MAVCCVVVVLTFDTLPRLRFDLADHLGSSNLLVDSEAAEISREEYTPYGETSFGRFALKRYRFAGKERDEESGLYYFGARFYAPWLARWMTRDPKTTARATPYGYVSGRAMTMIDPDGAEELPAYVRIQRASSPGEVQKIVSSLPMDEQRKLWKLAPGELSRGQGNAMAQAFAPGSHNFARLHRTNIAAAFARITSTTALGAVGGPALALTHWTGRAGALGLGIYGTAQGSRAASDPRLSRGERIEAGLSAATSAAFLLYGGYRAASRAWAGRSAAVMDRAVAEVGRETDVPIFKVMPVEG